MAAKDDALAAKDEVITANKKAATLDAKLKDTTTRLMHSEGKLDMRGALGVVSRRQGADRCQRSCCAHTGGMAGLCRCPALLSCNHTDGGGAADGYIWT